MAKVLTMNISQFKQKSLELLESIHGTSLVIIVTKRGKAIAKVQSYDSAIQNNEGRLKGTVLAEIDIVSPLGADLWKSAK